LAQLEPTLPQIEPSSGVRIPAYAKTGHNSAYVLLLGAPYELLSEAIAYDRLIFTEKYALIDELKDLDVGDRITRF
jgi:23S rRNA C2498 (ribose-2'-O)-methylase RlmM